VVNLPLHEHTRPQRPSAEMFVHLQQVIRHLVSYARPEDIEMLYLAICGLGWHEIEARTGVGHDAARKRVTRLRKSLRARFNRRDGVPRDP
jgi:hypothetical protein